MFLRFAGVLALLIVGVAGAFGQTLQTPVVIDQDLRVFTIVSALNVAGFDVELGSQYHPVRGELRKLAETLDPELLAKLKTFYQLHKNGRPDEEQLAKYISLAVVLSDPPGLKPIAREEALPDDAREVLAFADLAREFYEKAGISRQWSRLAPVYEREMDRIGPSIRNTVTRTDAYLRVPLGTSASQTMRITPELGAPQNSVNVRSNQDSFFVVVGYAANPKTEEIRHAYLHLRLNNYVTNALSKVEKSDRLTALLAGHDGVPREYSTNFQTMITESLIRAVELRIDRTPAARAEEVIRGYYRTGLLLTPYLYGALQTYEGGTASLPDDLASVFSAIDVAKEQARFQQTFSSIPLPERQATRGEVPVAPRTDPVLELLRTAQAAFERDKPKAREIFEQVLRDHDASNGRALYGIALIEMDKQNLDEALKYFERTLKSQSADPSMRTWSYIYSGHIYDFKCQRPAATESYRKALQTGDNSRDAQSVARRDLAQPFGGECPQ